MGKVTREKFKVLNGVFDENTLNTLETLKRKKYFDTLLEPIKTGKEADAYLVQKGDKYKVMKIYRVTTANFKKISQYINRDYRFKTIKGNLRKVIFAWVSKEFRNLHLCHKANMNVPFPYKQMGNVILMDYINGPMLKDIDLENPEEFFETLIEQMYLMLYEAKLVHGDLSEFNILVQDQLPVIIDLGQSMGIRNNDDFKIHYDLFLRDVENVVKYFTKRYKLEITVEEVLERLKKID